MAGQLGYAGTASPANNGKASVFNGAAENILYSGTMNVAGALTSAVVTPAGATWTQAELNALLARVGYSTATSANPQWHALMLQYDVAT